MRWEKALAARAPGSPPLVSCSGPSGFALQISWVTTFLYGVLGLVLGCAITMEGAEFR